MSFQSKYWNDVPEMSRWWVATRTRRSEALSRERIVEAAVELLDAAGEGGLTFRALTERLATGPGAIYWHVANKDELLAAATDAVVAGGAGHRARRLRRAGPGPCRRARPLRRDRRAPVGGGAALRQLLAGDGAEDPRERRPAGPRAGRAAGRWFTATSVLVQYILGAAAQNAANARTLGPDTDRGEFLDAVSTTWEELDPDDYPFTRAVADQMREHDDREQFLAGIDLILTGITAGEV